MDQPTPPRDRLNAIGVLARREIEARLLAPLLEAFSKEFGQQRVLEFTRQTIVEIARRQGVELAQSMGGCSLHHLADSLEAWKKDDAMQMDMLELTEGKFAFNVIRCRYAEMYRELGVPELGSVLSCRRDQALIEGFNPKIELKRTQTIMEGAPFCDFRYTVRGGA